MKTKLWLSRALLAFVLVTIGFALGRQTAPSPSIAADGQGVAAAPSTRTGDKLIIYSAHMTFRCWECNQIEWLTDELLDWQFAPQREAGLIEYQSVDYMRDADFARRYNIASSTLVLVRLEDGREVESERLDEVWTKVRNRDDFLAFVKGRIQAQLDQLARERAS